MNNLEKHFDRLKDLKDFRFMVSDFASGTEEVYSCDLTAFCDMCKFYWAGGNCMENRLEWLFAESEE